MFIFDGVIGDFVSVLEIIFVNSNRMYFTFKKILISYPCTSTTMKNYIEQNIFIIVIEGIWFNNW